MSSLSNAEGRQPHHSRRVAFFGGSFDPPHLGHLAVARAAQAALALDTVLFAPVGAQPLKPQGSTASFAHRVAMTRLAIAADPAFALSLADAPNTSGQPNFTLDTLLALRAELPPASALFCLMGADSFASFRRWHRAAEIPFVAPLIVAARPGERLDSLEPSLPNGLTIAFHPELDPSPTKGLRPIKLSRYILRNPDGELAPLYLLPSLAIDISASEIRAQIAQNAEGKAGERDFLPASVSAYIRAHDLYRDLPRPWRGSTITPGEFPHRMTNDTKQQTRILVQAASAVCEDKKGVDTRILELDPIDAGLSDFFLVTSATNDRQAIAIADEIEHRLKKDYGAFPNSVEGRRKGDWILLDYVDFVVHVFLAERRAFYDIERLRKSARPLTPAEFDAELKTELAQKTLAARQKASAKPAAAKTKPSIVKTKSTPKVKKSVKKSAPAKPALKAKKTAVPPKAAAKKAVRKAVARKPASGKAIARKPAAKNAPAKKSIQKKPVVKKTAPMKPAAKKPARKRS
jgi:nicotinate (nicotinamide) nucleotide adenylyltransferase/ribosome silencing factor RsfS/YbeB/iojap